MALGPAHGILMSVVYLPYFIHQVAFILCLHFEQYGISSAFSSISKLYLFEEYFYLYEILIRNF